MFMVTQPWFRILTVLLLIPTKCTGSKGTLTSFADTVDQVLTITGKHTSLQAPENSRLVHRYVFLQPPNNDTAITLERTCATEKPTHLRRFAQLQNNLNKYDYTVNESQSENQCFERLPTFAPVNLNAVTFYEHYPLQSVAPCRWLREASEPLSAVDEYTDVSLSSEDLAPPEEDTAEEEVHIGFAPPHEESTPNPVDLKLLEKICESPINRSELVIMNVGSQRVEKQAGSKSKLIPRRNAQSANLFDKLQRQRTSHSKPIARTSTKKLLSNATRINRPSTKTNRLRRDADKKRKKIKHVVEILFVIDHSVYLSWVKHLTQANPAITAEEIVKKIRAYYMYFEKEMNVVFDSIDDDRYSLRVAVVSITICTTPEAAFWTESIKYLERGNPKPCVDSKRALTMFSWWLNKKRRDIPQHDFGILVTRYDLTLQGRDKSIAGLAAVGQICDRRGSASIIEEFGGLSSVLSAAHELAHNLGADHDGVNNPCPASARHLMSPGMTPTRNKRVRKNVYKLSQCSIDQIYHRLVVQGRGVCLRRRNNPVSTGVDADLPMPGTVYGVNEQCKQKRNAQAYYFGGLESDDLICQQLQCAEPSGRDSVKIVGDMGAMSGTSCGNKKWCEQGECVHNEKAPAAKDVCTYGDSQWISSSCRARCHAQAKWRQLCCHTCNVTTLQETYETEEAKTSPETQESEEPSCTDTRGFINVRQTLECATIIPQYCYSSYIQQVCCATCEAKRGDDAKCKYGDRAENCKLQHCVMHSNRDVCCGTCKNFSIADFLVKLMRRRRTRGV